MVGRPPAARNPLWNLDGQAPEDIAPRRRVRQRSPPSEAAPERGSQRASTTPSARRLALAPRRRLEVAPPAVGFSVFPTSAQAATRDSCAAAAAAPRAPAALPADAPHGDRASSRIDSPSRSRSRRICSNSSTLDPILSATSRSGSEKPDRSSRGRTGVGPNQAVVVGPTQTVEPIPRGRSGPEGLRDWLRGEIERRTPSLSCSPIGVLGSRAVSRSCPYDTGCQ